MMSNRQLAFRNPLHVSSDNRIFSQGGTDTFSIQNVSEATDEGIDFRIIQSSGRIGQNARAFEKFAEEKVDLVVRKLVPPQAPTIAYELAYVLQDWEGVVEEVREDSFSARLLDRTRNLKYDTEIAEIPLEQVDDGDRELVVRGSIFYLTVKRRVLPIGRHDISTGIVFRRLPAWTQSTLDRAKHEADELLAFFETKFVRPSEE